MRFFNRFKSSKGNSFLGLSPLALLTLAACSGGSGGQSGGGGGSFSVGGNVIKGPLTNALVGLDYNGDGVVDSTTVRTGADGSYDISTSNSTYTVIAVTDDQTVDSSSGTVLSGITLKAPKGASVVTPTTTLMEEGGLTSEQVASVLGLPDGVDPTNFNPYASNVDLDHALAVEKASQQVINVVNSFAAAAEGAGASEVDAFKAALNSVAEVVKTKANKINDLTASEADKSLDLTSDADLTLIKTQVKTEITSTANVNSTAFNTLADDTTTAIKNVNNKIETVTDLTSDASKNIFSTTQVLADQVKTAVTAEVGNVGTGNISFTDANEVNTAAINKAPTNITLSSNSISETATSLVIGTLSTTDTDQSSGVAFIYKIAEVTGTDFSSFNINQTTGELSLLAQPDFETKASYNLTVLSTDEGGKTLSKSFIINVVDVNEAPTVANAIADQTFAEDSTLNFHITSSVFKDADAGDSLTYTASLSSGANLPSWLSFDAATRTFSGTPDNGDVGAIDVMITAADSSSESVSDTFTMTITNTNDAPTLVNDISNQTIAEDSALNFQLASNVFADVDQGDSLTYTASLSSGATLPSWLSFNAATQTFSGTPTNSDVGTIDVIATATDSGTQSVSDTFSITITNTNDAPEITSTPVTSINEDELYSYYFFYRDVDLGDQVTVSIESKPDWLSFDPSIRRLYGTPENNEVGVHSVAVKVTDVYGATGEQSFSIKVDNQNDAPTLSNAILDQTIAEDNALNFQLASNIFDDVDAGDVLTYSASLANGAALPSWLTFNATSRSFNGTPTNSNIGIIDVQATATDSGSESVSDTFSITVSNTNDAPERLNSTISNNIRWDGHLTSSDIIYRNFSDPDIVHGDSLKYSIEMKEVGLVPSWISINETTGILSVTPPIIDVRENPKTYQLDSYNSSSGEYSATDFLRLQNYFLTVSAKDKVGLTASSELVLAPEALFSIKTDTIEIKDYPKDKAAIENILNAELNYFSDIGNVLTLGSFNLDNNNLQLVKDKNGSSWNISTWPESPQLTFELATFDQINDFGNLGEISIFLGQVLNASETNIKTIESEEKYIQLNFTGDSELNTNGNLEFTFNPRLEGDIKYQSNASSLEASVSVSENKTLEFIPAENNEPAKLRVNILDLLDQLPFSGAVGALVPFEPGDFYVSIDGLPMETETGDFIDLIDAQFSIV